MLKLYNSLTRAKEEFTPLDAKNVRLYVCGPTVYDAAHIGNARPVIVFDVLYRLLRHLYGESHVKYVRNITDVDDKIIDRARRDFPDLPLNAAIKQVTTSTTEQFHADVAALGCLKPDEEPKATDHIEAMKDIIATLVDKGFAYAAEGHVLFRVDKMADYGKLSGRTTDAMLAEARIEAAAFKENPMDFVLWKPSDADQPGWDSDWGHGRPGWHLECSAMARAHLGEVFDIHGGGVDLKFPHHENEIAQSRCAFGTTKMATVWMHNGFLKVEGEKMSKSLGNFVTIRELLETQSFGEHAWRGEVLRFSMLMGHYRQPIDWTVSRLDESLRTLSKWYEKTWNSEPDPQIPSGVIGALCDDLDTPKAINLLHKMYNESQYSALKSSLQFLGFSGEREKLNRRYVYQVETVQYVIKGHDVQLIVRRNDGRTELDSESTAKIEKLIENRNATRTNKEFADTDSIRNALDRLGVVLKDHPDGTTTWGYKR